MGSDLCKTSRTEGVVYDSTQSIEDTEPLNLTHSSTLKPPPGSINKDIHTTFIECRLCRQFVPKEDSERHMLACLAPSSYNVTVLEVKVTDECPICLECFEIGDPLARLPCMCVYHKWCITAWCSRQRCCPVHLDMPI